MITYTEQTTTTVKVNNCVVGHIKHRTGKGYYYQPKGASKRFKSDYYESLSLLKQNLESQ
jgi:hypothetical protein